MKVSSQENLPGESSMANAGLTGSSSRRWTATELRKLPPDQRDAVLEAAAALAEDDYRNDPQLTAFEAFGKDDLYGESASAEAR
jgi:hypothetical protein